MEALDVPVRDPEIFYVFDAYCGWCYGLGPTLQAFHEANRDRVPFRVISGGLFTSSRRLPIRAFGHIQEANQRLTRLTGVSFGPAYEELLRQGTFVLDSEAAAAGLAALRAQAPDRGVELAGAMQRAFFGEGRSLSDPDTYAAIAREFGLDPDHAVAFFAGPEGRAAAEEDFSLARALGATSFPTLFLVHDQRLYRLPGVGTAPEAMTQHLDSVLGTMV